MELTKNYMPSEVEDRWYKHWLSKGYFNSKPDNRPSFTVVIPPPNVTGVLHMGHTLNETVQDILVRKARMTGFNACWVPGTDHASIATEARVVAMLKERGIDKNTLSREKFLEYAFEWKEKYGGIIYNQIEKLGCSVDWSRASFTMDDHYYKAVIKVFVDLYKKGLIYRGARMINWDPAAKTALSDEEVEHKDVAGKLYYIKYKLVDKDGNELSIGSNSPLEPVSQREIGGGNSTPLGDGEGNTIPSEIGGGGGNSPLGVVGDTGSIIIATQRPETIMGDTAICVNPDDDRYKNLAGAFAIVPLINRRIPIIFDEYVDKSFGTGALKVTPAHDINDYNLGLKHNLPVIDTLNEDGTLSAAAEIYIGEDRFTARKKIIAELKEKGFLQKEEEYQTRVGYSQRSGAVVEPRISTQWFLKMKEMAGPALKAVLDGDIKIHPGEKFLATYKYWLENVEDWCISRQLWWGQQIPAWYDENGNCYVGETEEEARADASPKGSKLTAHSSQLVRDADVLDTWFSSWLWPIEVFNGITQPGNAELKYYYPTKVLVTGQDIIFFWVARMVMAGMEYEKQIPFHDVYFTGMVRDKQGRKMSKSLGNSPDLLDLIAAYGADAVRFGIMISSPAGNDLLFDESSLEQGKFFNNKLWNALKLVKIWEGRQAVTQAPMSDSFAVLWFDNRLNEVKAEVNVLMGQFKLSEALKTIYSLIWDDFCSWYLEWVKPGFEQLIDVSVQGKTVLFFNELIQLLHPFMPFITEEIYHLLQEKEDDLCVKQFDTIKTAQQDILNTGALLKESITAIRDARNKARLKPKEEITLHIQPANKTHYAHIEALLAKQVNAKAVAYTTENIPQSIAVVMGKDKFYIVTDQPVQAGNQKEVLIKEQQHLLGFLASVEKKLSNERFVLNAKPDVIELERKKKSDAEAKLKVIEDSLSGL